MVSECIRLLTSAATGGRDFMRNMKIIRLAGSPSADQFSQSRPGQQTDSHSRAGDWHWNGRQNPQQSRKCHCFAITILLQVLLDQKGRNGNCQKT